MKQLLQLRGRAADEVAGRAPPLELPAMRQLVRERGQVIGAPIRQEDIVAERHRPPAAQPEHEGAEPAPDGGAGVFVRVDRGARSPARAVLLRRQRFIVKELADRRERLDVIGEDLEGREERYGEKGSPHAPEPPPEIPRPTRMATGLRVSPAAQDQAATTNCGLDDVDGQVRPGHQGAHDRSSGRSTSPAIVSKGPSRDRRPR